VRVVESGDGPRLGGGLCPQGMGFLGGISSRWPLGHTRPSWPFALAALRGPSHSGHEASRAGREADAERCRGTGEEPRNA